MRPIRLLSASSIVLLASIGLPTMPALAQTCDLGWSEGLFPRPGVDGEVYAVFSWHDADGPAVYVGGSFTIAGSAEATNVARWDGERWTALGEGIDGIVYSFATFDDGTGVALYIGGEFTSAGGVDASNIARWDGSRWSGLDDGVGGPVYAMAAEGNRLYVGGEFGTASGTPARNLAWWDGGSWNGPATGAGGSVRALHFHDDGTGRQLYVGGTFSAVAGGVSAGRIARWNPLMEIWTVLGSGVSGGGSESGVYALESFPAAGGDLYAGGTFSVAGGSSIDGLARWDGASWSAVGSGLNGAVRDLEVLGDGPAASLVVAGPFERAGGAFFGNGIARWDGAAWSTIGTGRQVFLDWSPLAVDTQDFGAGVVIFSGGIQPADNGITQFAGTGWADVVDDLPTTPLVGRSPIATLDFDGSNELYFSGDGFDGFPDEARVARWDGQRLSPLVGGEPLPRRPSGLVVFDDGTGPAIYAAGWPNTRSEYPVMRWDGSAWSTVGDPPLVMDVGGAMAEFDDGSGPALYVGGLEMTVGGALVGDVAKWDGSAWSSVGGGVAAGDRSGGAFALKVFDDGSGSALYAAGSFGEADGAPVNLVARWDGSGWRDAGLALDGTQIFDLEVFDGGDGPELFATGQITNAGGRSSLGIAKSDGVHWEALDAPSGLSGFGSALATFDNGDGEGLHVAGGFSRAGGVPASNIARWDGLAWSEVAGGLDGSASRIVEFDDGAGPALFVGGGFERAGGAVSVGLARYGCEPFVCRADLDGDGELTIFDFLAFQNLFDSGDPAADFDGDGSLTLFDFLAFQNDFDLGC